MKTKVRYQVIEKMCQRGRAIVRKWDQACSRFSSEKTEEAWLAQVGWHDVYFSHEVRCAVCSAAYVERDSE